MGVNVRIFVRWNGPPLDQVKLGHLSEKLRTDVSEAQFLVGEDIFGRPHKELSFCPIVADHHAWCAREGIKGEDEFEGQPNDAPFWEQDGPPIFGTSDEQFIEVHLLERYCDATRLGGRWPRIRETLEWLEMHFPGGVIYYGGDSSGILAHPSSRQQWQAIDDLYQLSESQRIRIHRARVARRR